MFLVSCPALVLASCAEGIVGSFPAHSTRSRDVFRQWLDEIEAGLALLRQTEPDANIAPYAVNLVTHHTNERLEGDLELCIRYQVPVVLTSKGALTDAVTRIHDYGGIVLHDVASRRHAEKAIEGGIDGLIVVAQGAGGHTGTINPFALMNEIRAFYDGPKRWRDLWSAGQGVGMARELISARVLVRQMKAEYREARRSFASVLAEDAERLTATAA